MPTRMKFKEKRIQRQQDALERATRRDQRGDQGQLSHLESQGYGHCKEAQRLRKSLGLSGPAGKDLPG